MRATSVRDLRSFTAVASRAEVIQMLMWCGDNDIALFRETPNYSLHTPDRKEPLPLVMEPVDLNQLVQFFTGFDPDREKIMKVFASPEDFTMLNLMWSSIRRIDSSV